MSDDREILLEAADYLEKLAAGQPGYEGDAEWCPDWMYRVVRHVQRNMSIECPVHEPWNGPDTSDECGQPGRYDGPLIALLRNLVPHLVRVLRVCADFVAFSSVAVETTDPILELAEAILEVKRERYSR